MDAEGLEECCLGHSVVRQMKMPNKCRSLMACLSLSISVPTINIGTTKVVLRAVHPRDCVRREFCHQCGLWSRLAAIVATGSAIAGATPSSSCHVLRLFNFSRLILQYQFSRRCMPFPQRPIFSYRFSVATVLWAGSQGSRPTARDIRNKDEMHTCLF